MRFLLALVSLMNPFALAVAQPILKVSSVAWQGLTPDEKSFIQGRYVVESVTSDAFGLIIDNQGVDKSTPGTSGGAVLGEAVGSAAYIDKAFSGGNYSAKNHLGALLLGGLVGSALDSRPQSQYHFRYALKLGNGSIVYQDSYSSEPFRHPVGICVLLPAITIAPEQHLCTQTTETLRGANVPSNVVQTALPIVPTIGATSKTIAPVKAPSAEFDSKSELVSCRLNSLAPVRTTPEKCKLINGVVLND